MKNSAQKITKLQCLVLSSFGLALVIGSVSCKTGNATKTPPPAAASAGHHYYTCAMHPEVRSLDPDGKCPFCQMMLFPAETIEIVDQDTGKTNAAASFPAVSGYYSCPMHPTVLSHERDDKCPICGMALLPVESPAFIRTK